MAKAKRDKTTGLPIPSPVVPPTSICYTILVPNAPEYRSAFKGALSSLGQAWTWAQTEGQDNQPAFDAAELWRERIANASYNLDCSEMPLDCLDVANCILTNPETRAAVGAVSTATPIPGMTYPPAVPLTPGQMTARLNEIDDCGFDAFWAQSEQYIDFMVDLGQDVLDQIAVYSAALDAGENIPMGQFLGKLKNSSTAGKVIEFLQWALEIVKGAYEAADNEGNRDALKCAIFCEGKFDCLISIQRTLDILNERNGGILTPGDLEDLPALVDAFTSSFFNPALALDLWLLFLMGTAKTAGMFGLQGIDETLNLVLAVAVNDANNDWELKCEDCEGEVWDEWDFSTGSMFEFYPAPGYAVFSNGWIVDADPTQIAFKRPHMGQTYVEVEIFFQAVVAGTMVAASVGNENATGFVTTASTDQIKWSGPGFFAGGFFVDFVNSPSLVGEKIVKMRAKRA